MSYSKYRIIAACIVFGLSGLNAKEWTRPSFTNPRIIIIGCVSGIGNELTKLCAHQRWTLGLVDIAEHKLAVLGDTLKKTTKVFTKRIDITQGKVAISKLNNLIKKMAGVDVVVIGAGVGFNDPDLQWEHDKQTIAVNVAGFTAMADTVMRYFEQQRRGHLVGISSILAIRGTASTPVYSASKAFVSSYLGAMRGRIIKKQLSHVYITDVQPGYVDTPLVRGLHEDIFFKNPLLVTAPRKAAEQIYEAILKRKKHAFITKRWRLVSWLMYTTPDRLYHQCC